MSFLTGSPAEYGLVNNLQPYQQKVQQQAASAATGAYPAAAQYYQNNLSNNPQDFQAFAAPEMRQFQEQTIPGLAEQFAGMGSGGLSSSGFRNAGVQAGTDLSERLGALRAQLRESAASGLQNIGKQATNPTSSLQQTAEATPGLAGFAGSILGSGAAAFGGPILGALGTAAGNWLSNKFGPSVSQGSDWKGGQSGATPGYTPFKAPSFQTNMRG